MLSSVLAAFQKSRLQRSPKLAAMFTHSLLPFAATQREDVLRVGVIACLNQTSSSKKNENALWKCCCMSVVNSIPVRR